jgi:hypothetical protein
MMKFDHNQAPIILIAKDKPCECHVCIDILCHNCNKKVFITQEKIDIYNQNKSRAFCLCVKCLVWSQEIFPKLKMIEVKLDQPQGGIN